MYNSALFSLYDRGFALSFLSSPCTRLHTRAAALSGSGNSGNKLQLSLTSQRLRAKADNYTRECKPVSAMDSLGLFCLIYPGLLVFACYIYILEQQ